AHLLLAVLFIGPYRDPVRNKWVLDFGLLACAAVVPLALIAGPLRGIPLYWRLIDCSFGLLGAIPLYLARRHTIALERSQHARSPPTSPHTPTATTSQRHRPPHPAASGPAPPPTAAAAAPPR